MGLDGLFVNGIVNVKQCEGSYWIYVARDREHDNESYGCMRAVAGCYY
jgi:hypothetical protein